MLYIPPCTICYGVPIPWLKLGNGATSGLTVWSTYLCQLAFCFIIAHVDLQGSSWLRIPLFLSFTLDSSQY